MSVSRRLWVAFMAGIFSQTGCRLTESADKWVAVVGAVVWLASIVVFAALAPHIKEGEN